MKLKPHYFALATVLALVPATGSAQLAVFDPSNFMQNLQQVIQMGTELQQLRDQLEQIKQLKNNAESQLKSVTGSRGLGSITTDTNRAFMNGLSGVSPDVASLVSDIKAKAGYLSTQDLGSINGAYRQRLLDQGDQAAQAQAMNTMVFKHSGQQFANIQTLMDRINTTNDPKAIDELQARIQVENAMLQNEAVQAQAMASALETQERVNRQAAMQRSASQRVDYYKGGE